MFFLETLSIIGGMSTSTMMHRSILVCFVHNHEFTLTSIPHGVCEIKWMRTWLLGSIGTGPAGSSVIIRV
ncbi:hypothetical protein AMELA_G00241420, partial [Ameiurus melas]